MWESWGPSHRENNPVLGRLDAVVEFTSGSQRLIGAIVPHGDATWFFKLTGPDTVVAAEKPAFLLFLQTISAP